MQHRMVLEHFRRAKMQEESDMETLIVAQSTDIL